MMTEVLNTAIKAAPFIALALLFLFMAIVLIAKWTTGELPEPGNDDDGTDDFYCERNPRPYNFKPKAGNNS